MAIKTIKMSELPEAVRPDNLKVPANIEEDGVQSTYLVDLGFIKESADSANAAASAADAARAGIQGDLGKLQSQIDQINQYQFVYGIEKELTSAATTWTRVGNMALHRSLPIQSKMRSCLLLDDGTVNYYLHPDTKELKEDGSPAVLDGTDGQVEVWIPPHYYDSGIKDGKMYRYMSEYPFSGSIYFEGGYVSAYHAAIDRTDPAKPKLCSVVNKSPEFRGGNNTAVWDGTYRDLRGMPGTAIDLASYRAYARRRGIAGKNDAGWNAYAYGLMVAVYWSYTVEYANLNVQAAYNPALTSEGFRQGGLGAGVTTLNGTAWADYNNTNPVIPCGHTNSLGNNTGIVPFAIPAEYGGSPTINVPSYRGIENPFGHIHNLIDGCFVGVQSNEAGGVSRLYVCDDLTKYGSSNYADYEDRGTVSRVGGYITRILMGKHGDTVASAVDGSSSTFFADYFTTGTPPPAGTDRRSVLMGGSATLNTQSGLTCMYTNNSIVISGNSMGTRLCFIPE